MVEDDMFNAVSEPQASTTHPSAAPEVIDELTGPSLGRVPQGRQSQWWFVGTAAVVAMLGLFSTRIGSIDVEPATASDLRGLLGALSAVSIMWLGLQLVLVGILTDRSGTWKVRRPPHALWTVLAAVIAGLACAAGALILIESSPAFEAKAAIAIGFAVGSTVLSIPSRSVLLGEERWRDLALVGVSSAGCRLAVTAGAASTDRIDAVLGGLVLGEIVGALIAVTIARDAQRVDRWPTAMARHLRIGALASAGLMLVISLSSLSVGRFLHDEVQTYNQSAAVARLVFILTFTVAFVSFPTMAREPIGSVLLRRRFHNGLLLALFTAVLASGSIVLFPSWFLSLVNADPQVSTATMQVLAVAFAFYGLAGISLMQYIAHGSRFALSTLTLVPVLVVGHLLADSALALAWFTLGSSLVLLALASIPALARVQPTLHPETIRHPHDSTAAIDAVTIIVPSYNPGPVVVETIAQIFACFDEADVDARVVVVSDGSTDGSQALIEACRSERLSHICHDGNKGKGAALRTGFEAARTPVVGFVDADGDLHPSHLVDMARIRQETGADIVFGSKRHSASSVSVPFPRRVISRIYEAMIRHMFQLDIADTQTGIKLFSAPVLDASLPLLEETGFALDLELFVAARANGFHHFVEIPVEMIRQGGSTISAHSIVRTTADTLRIFWRAKVTLHYLRSTFASDRRPPNDVGSAAI
jgi:hypothetical protein